MSKLKVGNRVSWSYRHWLNSKSSIMKIKFGVITAINQTLVSVLFDGNKNPAIKPYSALTLIEAEQKNAPDQKSEGCPSCNGKNGKHYHTCKYLNLAGNF